MKKAIRMILQMVLKGKAPKPGRKPIVDIDQRTGEPLFV